MTSQKSLKPFVKWAGGKRQLLERILPCIDIQNRTYVEPFVGGGAVLFSLCPERAIINDQNQELINVYQVIKDNPDDLIALLKIHEEKNCEDYYYAIRQMDRDPDYLSCDQITKAARFLYLNKTGYNGLYRVNQSGFHNVPYGKYKHPVIVNEEGIREISVYLNHADIQIFSHDYQQILSSIPDQSFVYLDPPYMPLTKTASFTGYTPGGFDYSEQVRLASACHELSRKNIPFLQSNSDCPAIRQLYQDYEIITVQAGRAINCNGKKRKKIDEVLIYSR